MRRTLIAAAATASAFVCASVVAGTQRPETKAHVMVTPSSVTWGPGPASIPAGAQAAVIEGDPTKRGLFTLRLKMPDGYKIAPHFHPVDERVTVLQGTFVIGIGEKFDQSAGAELGAGSFAVMPTGTRHFAWTKGETIIQLHGIGPWGVTYVNPADDPRKKPSE
jgi:quercetin dioxygenase-like cupin family protein